MKNKYFDRVFPFEVQMYLFESTNNIFGKYQQAKLQDVSSNILTKYSYQTVNMSKYCRSIR